MWAVALHGGAGNIQKTLAIEGQQNYINGLETALEIGKNILKNNGSAKDCVENVVRYLEDFPLFNAGKGSVFNEQGSHELEASIMDGDGAIGSAIGLKNIKNPISLARKIMEDTSKPYAIEGLANKYQVERVENSYFSTEKRLEELRRVQLEINTLKITEAKKDESTGTVGCVALDMSGKLCAGTSTGGTTNKPVGRIGDSPIIGAGTYANNNTCAISGTGRGEIFIKEVICYDVHARMVYKNCSLSEAMEEVVKEKLKNREGGIVGVDKTGEIKLSYSSEGMFRAGANSKGVHVVKIWE